MRVTLELDAWELDEVRRHIRGKLRAYCAHELLEHEKPTKDKLLALEAKIEQAEKEMVRKPSP